MTIIKPTLDVDLLDPTFLSDPYPTYVALRHEDAITWSERLQCWLVPGYDAVEAMLRDKRLGKDPRYANLSAAESASEIMTMKSRWILHRDGDFHARIKRLQSSVLSPQQNVPLTDLAARVVAEMLRPVRAGEWFDVMEVLALDLPYVIISTLLGVPDLDRERLRLWSRDLFATLEPGMTQEKWDRGEEAARNLRHLFGSLLADAQDDAAPLMSSYRRAIDAGQATAEEIEATCALMFVAGHETTSHFLGTAIVALARNPEQLAKVREAGGFAPAHVTELLRYDGSVQNTSRVALEDVEVNGHRINAGQRVLLLLASANRDDRKFPGADELELERQAGPHLALGLGPHYCPGGWLARQQSLVALNALLALGPRWQVDEDTVIWRRSSQVRGPESLRLRIGT
ncbi:cytochrome P450 [Kribbella sp. NPDC023972]|uniref:cytochrome P450 n=1 Tax=Kribbella sp. NPDC023972 TaxID=3154795 RepID=UPI0034103E56